MVTLRNFVEADAAALQRLKYNDMSIGEISSMIRDWNQGGAQGMQGAYYEMFAIILDENEIDEAAGVDNAAGIVAGTISLYQHSDSVISIGPEVFDAYKRRGIGKAAMLSAMKIAKEKGYKIACHQIRTDNAPSLALHRSLGFETDGYVYRNKKGNEVLIFLKAL